MAQGRSLPTSEQSQNGAPTWDTRLFQRDWMEKTRGTLMLVATVIATMTFQTAVNPPGGVWQTNTNKMDDGCALGNNKTCKAGTSVLAAAGSDQMLRYEIFILLCTISFTASQSIILLMICGFSLRIRLVMWLLIIAMSVSVICTAAAYAISIWMLMQQHDSAVSIIALYYARFWAGLAAFLFLVLLCRLMLWLLKELYRLLRCCRRSV